VLRYVRFAERADRNRRALPDAVRRLVTDKLIELAAMPGNLISPDVAVVASAGRGAREASLVIHGRWSVLIVHRVSPETDELWVLAIEPIHSG
jgi:hypothetical protein